MGACAPVVIGRNQDPLIGLPDNQAMVPTDPTQPTTESTSAAAPGGFDPNQTISYQSMPRAKRAPKWVHSFLASNSREKNRLRNELGKIKGAVPLLMKTRNGGRWTAQDRTDLQHIVRAASAVSPYLFIWALPGSVLLLPFLAWHLDARRKNRERKAAGGPKV